MYTCTAINVSLFVITCSCIYGIMIIVILLLLLMYLVQYIAVVYSNVFVTHKHCTLALYIHCTLAAVVIRCSVATVMGSRVVSLDNACIG